MRYPLINAIFPHYCCSCGQIGSILCDYCKYNIVSEVPVQCLACLGLVGQYGAVCQSCKVPYNKGWFVAHHRGAVRHLVGQCKFKHRRAATVTLAQLLNDTLPQLPTGVIVVPVPTVRAHARERGFDHTLAIACEFARLRGLTVKRALERTSATMQRGASRAQRIKQAASAFYAPKPLNGGAYLVIDDVCTTGATLFYAAKALKGAGANEVWVAAASREPMD